MRTTLTIDADVALLIEDEVHRTRSPRKQVINDAIRKALSPRMGDATLAAYAVVPHHAVLHPGFDRMGFNRLPDELEEDFFVAQHAADKT